MNNQILNSIAIIGGGPAALMILKHILKQSVQPKNIYIFEKNERFGAGMPYGKLGSLKEHVANVSANELPELVDTFKQYLKENPSSDFKDFSDSENFNPYQVIPRLLLGDYLENQFKQYIKLAQKEGIKVFAKNKTMVTDISKLEGKDQFKITTHQSEKIIADKVIICTGHVWPKMQEEKIKGWFDSPYPPSKFKETSNFPVAIRGTSLTAIDAVKTIARLNGKFIETDNGHIKYHLNKNSENFKIHMFSTGGFLPALRFHSEDDAYSSEWTMSLQEIYDYKKKNGGFVDLDYVFEINFKLPIKQKDPEFYNLIKKFSLEEFAEKMLGFREKSDSFDLFKAEYREAEKSIEKRQSITWKEKLAAFSYSMNYPAKHFSAEDMLRLKSALMPLISVIIASLPQSSYREIMALHDTGLIELIQVNKDSSVEPHPESGGIYCYKTEDGKDMKSYYKMYIDAIGQQQMNLKDFPFEGLKDENVISSAYLAFKDYQKGKEMFENHTENVVEGHNNNYYLKVPGLGINDYFQALNVYGEATENLFIMAVPFIGGLNPDYSGLDFCDTAAEKIAKALSNCNAPVIDINPVEEQQGNIQANII
ncbi:FAD/NAD(P)-binding protein [Chryseobacterium sp. RLHN22]|uniref:FAD/NAD(P)-binding protein n=1 Tax=Chryseobacterium sp. RLHN22 TaxID=3437885 RepID=UPI003D9B8176